MVCKVSRRLREPCLQALSGQGWSSRNLGPTFTRDCSCVMPHTTARARNFCPSSSYPRITLPLRLIQTECSSWRSPPPDPRHRRRRINSSSHRSWPAPGRHQQTEPRRPPPPNLHPDRAVRLHHSEDERREHFFQIFKSWHNFLVIWGSDILRRKGWNWAPNWYSFLIHSRTLASASLSPAI